MYVSTPTNLNKNKETDEDFAKIYTLLSVKLFLSLYSKKNMRYISIGKT
jgi:hypothetical protein